MILTVDLSWLLQTAQEQLPGDPDVLDYGALEAARARHCAVVMGNTVYPEPHHRAAALLQSLVRLPALEHSNELFAVTIAAAYLRASGRPVKVATDQAADLVAQSASGQLSVRDIAAALRTWTHGD
ncbi:fic family toxin-antitoxin system, toxin component [Streptomyces tubercidicus]|uniref:Toxin Doc n=1 Tax=Streptomyces tubercidicus TaxID=47759 RepID=A0A640UMV3_9ACTN|nr:fic family toxin-antitoxin system, toxin component [Streptomyces tubercidicus]WAU11396.1 fic family toxin-antitoxin system, toxin component [Streptomyces tubercidicus]GFE36652.1 toxin Doc [Streptomyces tubercidicus]